MSGRFTLDTSILVYASVPASDLRHHLAQQVVGMATLQDCTPTFQALAEFYNATTRKGLLQRFVEAELVRSWLDLFPIVAASEAAVRFALTASTDRLVSYWDAQLVATAAEAGCTSVLSEDMGNGSVIAGVRIINPFGDTGLSMEAVRLLEPQAGLRCRRFGSTPLRNSVLQHPPQSV